MRFRIGLAVLAFLVLVSVAPRAFANAAASFHASPENAAGALLAGPTPLAITHERLVLDCAPGTREEERDGPTCAFEASYDVMNPTAAEQVALGGFASPRALAVRASFRVDGDPSSLPVDASVVLSPEQTSEVQADVGRRDSSHRGNAIAGELSGFRVALPAGGAGTLVFTGKLGPVFEQWHRESYSVAPILARHVLLGQSPTDERAFDFLYLIAPIRSWAGDPAIDVTIRSPSAWTLAPFAAGGGARSQRTSGGKTEVTARLSKQDDALALRFAMGARVVFNGGPFVGYGLRLDHGERRVRFGYEVALPSPYTIAAVAVETSFHGRTVIVPTYEVASPDVLLLFPSLALGVGVPVSLREGQSTLVGGRVSFTASWPLISLLIPLDVYPGGRGSEVVAIAFMAQISF